METCSGVAGNAQRIKYEWTRNRVRSLVGHETRKLNAVAPQNTGAMPLLNDVSTALLPQLISDMLYQHDFQSPGERPHHLFCE